MSTFVLSQARLVEQWGLPLLAFAMTGAITLVVALRRKNRRWIPPTPGGKAVVIVSLLAAIAFSVAALLLAGPLRPLVTTEARFDSWIGQPFPDLPMTRVRDGRASHLRDYHGQVVVLNLWATWCPPCRQEMPDLARLATTYEGRGIAVVPISDDQVAQQKRFHVKIALPSEAQAIGSLGWDSGTFRPFTLILDREGRLREYSFGAHDYAWFERRAKRYL
jgi:cytochrome c biogenesis protein CcmG, thiol:disulfide interchange protein DsbE